MQCPLTERPRRLMQNVRLGLIRLRLKARTLTTRTRGGKRLLGIEVMTGRVLRKKAAKNTTLHNMDKILKFFGSSVIGDIGKIIDDLFTSDEERDAAKHKIISVLKEKELELQRMQTDIIIAEAKGNWLQRSWRPILMLSFGFIIIYNKFAAPLFGWPIPVLEGEFWTLLQIGIGGYVVGRSAEKIADKIKITKK
jgi:hypothetical protein